MIALPIFSQSSDPCIDLGIYSDIFISPDEDNNQELDEQCAFKVFEIQLLDYDDLQFITTWEIEPFGSAKIVSEGNNFIRFYGS